MVGLRSPGWAFVVGKTASCAAMALTFAAYAVPGTAGCSGWSPWRPSLALTAVNYRGISRTAQAHPAAGRASPRAACSSGRARSLASGETDAGRLGHWPSLGAGGRARRAAGGGLLFFAFAGYARIATLGEEVRDPARTIPRAIPIALGIVVALYLVVGAGGSGRRRALPALAAGTTPLATAVDAVGAAWALPVVRVGAAVASLGALLALIAGVGRTSLAMARNGDLPRWLGVRASALSGAGPRRACRRRRRCRRRRSRPTSAARSAFSSFGVLLYYAIANASAFTQPAKRRRWPRALNVIGCIGCVVLVAALPLSAIAVGSAVLAVGLAGRVVVTGGSLAPWRRSSSRARRSSPSGDA